MSLGPYRNGRHWPIAPRKGSWADEEQKRQTPPPSKTKVAGFLAFALAVTAVTTTPAAHADMLKDFGLDLRRAARDAGIDTVNSTIVAATPDSAKRAALGLPGQRSTVTDKVIGRVMKDASSYTYGSYGSAQSALKVPGLPGSGNLPGRGGSLGKSISNSVSDVANDAAEDTVQSVTSSMVGKVLGVLFDHDDSPSP